MITVKLHQTSSPRNKIGKTLDAGLDFSCCLKDDCSILNPRLDIFTDADITGRNYLYIPAFGRYYFIDDIVSTNNGYWTITAHVDVLETYKDQIKANRAVIRRQENVFNLYLDDPDFQVYNYENIQTLQFAATTDLSKSLQYVIVTNGAGNTQAREEVGE